MDKLKEKNGIATAVIITFEFMDLVADMCKKEMSNPDEFFTEIKEEDAIGKYIFEGSCYSKLGKSTNRQVLLSAYYRYAKLYVALTMINYHIKNQ